MNEIDLYRNARANSGDIIKMLPLAHDKDIDKFIKFMNDWALLKVQHYLGDDTKPTNPD